MFVSQFVKAVLPISSITSRCLSSAAVGANPVKRLLPRRSLLYIPGNEEDQIKNVSKLGADCVILDCEDCVSINDKEAARISVTRNLDLVDFGRTEPIVRINSVKSGMAIEDIKVILEATHIPSTFMLPKVENPSDFDWLVEALHDRLRKIKKRKIGNFKALLSVETALGLLNLESICRRAHELMELGIPVHLDGVIFGSNDYHTNIGAERTKDANELIYVRQKIITIAKAFNLQAIDMIHSDVNDVGGLKLQSLEGAKIGFTGKQVVHPSQISIVNECFTPSSEKLEWARELIEAGKDHKVNGKGAFIFKDKKIDSALLRQAQDVAEFMEHLKDSKVSLSQSAEGTFKK